MMNIARQFFYAIIIVRLLILPIGFGSSASDNLLEVKGPCNLKFPKDHGPHEAYRTEWWYYTGNVSDSNGSIFGFQLTFFRFHIESEAVDQKKALGTSAWRSTQLILAHAALSDIAGKKHYQAEQMARQALSIAGAVQENDKTTVFLKNWSLKMRPQNHRLEAATSDFSLNFILTPMKNPVLHGDQGYSRKGGKAESASCYYSFTRLKAGGTIHIGNKTFEVDGSAWMDHEFSTNPLEPDLAGWDWFSIQLDNHTELMAYFLRRHDGTFSDASSGTFVTKEGKGIHLSHSDLDLEILNVWKSNRTGAVYPSQWRLKIAHMNLNLNITTLLPDQEMKTAETTRVVYWEGSVVVDCLCDGKSIKGKGYVELTGYAEPFDAPI